MSLAVTGVTSSTARLTFARTLLNSLDFRAKYLNDASHYLTPISCSARSQCYRYKFSNCSSGCLNASGILSKSFSFIGFTICLYGQGEGVGVAVVVVVSPLLA